MALTTAEFSYNGTYTTAVEEHTGIGSVFVLYLTGNGTLVLNKNYTVDIWLCGGGGCGATGSSSPYGGGGGAGGYVAQQNGALLEKGTEYDAVIGEGSTLWANAGGTTSFFSLEAAGGTRGTNARYGGTGGSGGGAGASADFRSTTDATSGAQNGASVTGSYGGSGAGTSTYMFGDSILTLCCSGGGGGGASYSRDLGAIYHSNQGKSAAGAPGAGDGASAPNLKGTAATGYGCGGGGGYGHYSEAYQSGDTTKGGAGYQGVVAIRFLEAAENGPYWGIKKNGVVSKLTGVPGVRNSGSIVIPRWGVRKNGEIVWFN